MYMLSMIDAAALPDTTAAPLASPSLTCTLVDGGPVGGTFCNRYVGTSTLTDTVWVTTGTTAFNVPIHDGLTYDSDSLGYFNIVSGSC
jgi:hypothetical protein